MIPRVLFYSYKGGTGRSSAAANIAMQLAIMGRRILLVDLDIEGPSLDVILGFEEGEIDKDLYIQDYLISPDPDSWNYRRAIWDIKSYLKQKDNLENDIPGEIYFLPASSSYEKTVHFHGDTVQVKLTDLFGKIEKEYSLDAILMDCPNGYGPMTQKSFFMADLILLFFKWSKQHITGSGKISEIMRYLDIEYWPIPCVVPIDVREAVYSMYREKLIKRLKHDTVGIIHENETFKWEEQVVMHVKQGFRTNGSDLDQKQNQELIKEYEELSKLINDYISRFVSLP